MNISTAQKHIVDNYFTYLRHNGYMNIKKTNQVVFSILLLDAVNMFGEFITNSFANSVTKIMRNLDCCNCSITWNSINASSPFYISSQYSIDSIPVHTHIINEIVGLSGAINDINNRIKKVDAKANAGL